ncbi:hypothetical protein BB561_001205 [Smittium simulii]|uniref:lysine--tRNA ligase n=1 Tax=Smittium simulii TaxID=133385 RepID=A0A2T9YVL9_9FUNG|nr:hypothetical protein BB561_001205 [Smittium simulii]
MFYKSLYSAALRSSRVRKSPFKSISWNNYSTIPASDSRNLKDARLLKIKENNTVPFPRYTKPLASPNGGVCSEAADIESLISKYSNLQPNQKILIKKVYIEGRIYSKRSSGKKLYFYFIYKNNKKIQIVSELSYLNQKTDPDCVSEKKVAEENISSSSRDFIQINKSLHVGDIIRAIGYIGKTKTGELSIYTTENIEILSTCYSSLPVLSKLDNVETRLRNRHLDFLLNQKSRDVIYTRANILKSIRHFFDSRGFLEVETPILWPKLGGANAKPFTTKASALQNSDLFLRISPELFLKRLVIGGFDKVYEIGKSFRNEGIDKSHNPEFTSCEFYQAYANIDDLLNTTESLLQDIIKKVNNGSTKLEVNALSKQPNYNDINIEKSNNILVLDFASPFKKINVIQFLSEKLNCNFDFLDPSKYLEILELTTSNRTELDQYHTQKHTDYIVKKLLEICSLNKVKTSGIPKTPNKIMDLLISIYIEPECIQPTFLTDHPTFMSPLAKAKDNISSARFELIINKREYVNAYEELNDPEEQRARFINQLNDRKSGDLEAVPPDDEYCDALEFALPPTAGWGLGVDRLVSLVTNSANLRETISFPIIK